MKLLIHTQWFDPEPNTFKGLSFAKALKESGIDSFVLTGFPNYPEGKIYSNYSGLLPRKELMDGISVYRTSIFPSHNRSAFLRSLNYLSFFISSVLRGFFCPKPDIIYSYHPPITTALSSWILSSYWRIPLVLDIQDMWPETLLTTGMVKNKTLLTFLKFLCFFVYKRASKIVVLSEGFKNHLIKNGISSSKISVIYNWTNESVSENDEFEFLDQELLKFTFAGNIGPGQDLITFIQAFSSINNEKEKAELHIYGEGTQKKEIEEFIQRNNIKHTYLNNRVSDSEIKSIYKQSDVLLVHLKDDKLFEMTIPSKTQAYLLAGKPILMAVKGEAANIVKSSRSGITCNPEDINSVRIAIDNLIKMSKEEREEMGDAGKSFYNKEMSMSRGVKKFVQLFKEVTQ